MALPAHRVHADTPHVATDIAPVHSLVAQVMEGVGTPDLILPPGADPHGHSLRPSEASALERADLVVWVGPALTPWLKNPLETLAAKAQHRVLMDVDGTILIAMRDGAGFEGHDHGHENRDDHEDHEEHGDHDDHDDHDDHEDHDEHQHNDGGPIDPHAWLDPENALLWLSAITEDLAALDPENASIYAANAAKGQARILQAQSQAQALLAPLHDTPFIVMHDAYHYFEARFDLHARAAITSGDAERPSPARIDEVRHIAEDTGTRCIVAETAANSGLVEAVLPGGQDHVTVIDPLGTQFNPGPHLYPALLSDVAIRLSECFQN
ncbi:zinc ABC transporter substrate-binding protein [Roseovarius aestuarii]|nr:zinc ABC transporter substrate-binding protein [Roseovarius aestuarii]